MRVPSKQEMKKLAILSQARERMALEELAAVSARRSAASARVRQLRAQTEAASKTDDAAVFQKWLLWRDQEIARRLVHLAAVTAEYVETSRRCGRVIAENAVVETLADQAAREAEEAKAKSGSYDLAMTSHLLSDDIGDEDI